MTPEQAEAVERLRTVLAGDDPREWIDFDDVRLLLAEHASGHSPADDNEPVTEEWLREIGFVFEGRLSRKWTFYRRDALPIGLWDADDGWTAVLILSDRSSANIVRRQSTRGDVRRLCSALGITLKETEAT